MTQKDRWIIRIKKWSIIETYHRNPSKYVGAERELVNWTKQQRKLMNAGELKEPRLGMFKDLLELSEKYKHVNQWIWWFRKYSKNLL